PATLRRPRGQPGPGSGGPADPAEYDPTNRTTSRIELRAQCCPAQIHLIRTAAGPHKLDPAAAPNGGSVRTGRGQAAFAERDRNAGSLVPCRDWECLPTPLAYVRVRAHYRPMSLRSRV